MLRSAKPMLKRHQNTQVDFVIHFTCSLFSHQIVAKTDFDEFKILHTDRLSLLGNHNHYLPSLSNNANRSSFTTTAPNTTTFDYLYEFSETRKVLEDFFKCPTNDEEKKIVDCFNESDAGSLVCNGTVAAHRLNTGE